MALFCMKTNQDWLRCELCHWREKQLFEPFKVGTQMQKISFYYFIFFIALTLQAAKYNRGIKKLSDGTNSKWEIKCISSRLK